MDIPKGILIGSVKWDLVRDDDNLDKEHSYGQCNFHSSKIRYQCEVMGVPRKHSAINMTITHELIHAILSSIGYEDLSEDEVFVKSLSVPLHQVIEQIVDHSISIEKSMTKTP